MKRKIAVVTGTRAEYGILKPLIEKIDQSTSLDLNLMVTGMHLLREYGLTVKEIARDGFKLSGTVNMYPRKGSNGAAYHGKALGIATANFAKVLSQLKPDMLVVLGDRLEPLAAVLAAATLNIPIAHIAGGDKTDSGHIDESIRYAITRFAHLHFTATKKHAARLLAMGEEPFRVLNVGSLGLDSIVGQKLLDKKKLFKKLGLCSGKKVIVCVFHSNQMEIDLAGKHMRVILRALSEINLQTVLIYPNNDNGSEAIIREIEVNKKSDFLKPFKNLSHLEYISLLRYADVLVGNSSSGILESTTLRLPAINIGARNIGREHAKNVIFIDSVKDKIQKAVMKALYDEKFKEAAKKCKSPYGKGNASQQIIKVLSSIGMGKKLLHKQITY
ncbi:MAG: UDP-N-acetylglucosamine 2-epimerase (hydrolyzing) [Candidatus Saganbacteria bacterium]|nr:UDP-N-acetylglucosamine 2-epimerase (hydrolyzing) [Candidatus Saganbacteria bacterium]